MASETMIKAIRLMVRTNKSQREVAKELGITEATISKWKHRDDYDEVRLKEEREYLGDLASPALRTMRELLNSRSDLVRFNAASDILDRTGFKPVDKQQVEHSGLVVFADDIDKDH